MSVCILGTCGCWRPVLWPFLGFTEFQGAGCLGNNLGKQCWTERQESRVECCEGQRKCKQELQRVTQLSFLSWKKASGTWGQGTGRPSPHPDPEAVEAASPARGLDPVLLQAWMSCTPATGLSREQRCIAPSSGSCAGPLWHTSFITLGASITTQGQDQHVGARHSLESGSVRPRLENFTVQIRPAPGEASEEPNNLVIKINSILTQYF